MSGNNFNISMVLRADVGSAKSGLTEVSTGLKTLTSESAKAGAATAKQAADLEAMAAAAVKAMGAQDGLVAAEKRAGETRTRALVAPLANAGGSAPVMSAVFKQTETAAGSLQTAVSGLGTAMSSQVQHMVYSAEAARDYQSALMDIRASFNPLFAASLQYEQQLERINAAEKEGAFGAYGSAAAQREAAKARELAAQSLLSPVLPGQQRPGAIRPGAYTANIGAQGFDIGVTAAMGMNPLMIGLQQGSQLAGIAQQMGGGAKAAKEMASGLLSIVNPASLITIGLTTLAAVGIQAFFTMTGKAKTLEDRMDALSGAFDRYKSSADIAGASSADRARQFGVAASAAQGLYTVLANLDKLAVEEKLKATNTAIRETLGMPLGRDLRGNSLRNISTFFDLKPGYGGFGQEDPGKAKAFKGAVDGFEAAKGTDAQIAAMQTLLEQTETLVKLKGGVSEKEQGLLDLIKKQADVLLGIKAVETARSEERKRQVAQMVLGYQQQAALSATETQFGAASIQVERLKAAQARENLDIRLRDMDVLEGGTEWLRAHLALTKQLAAEDAQVADAKRRQVDAISLGYRQESELAAVRRQFGADSLQVEAVRARQAREALDLRLEGLGVDEKSNEWAQAHLDLADQQRQREQDITDAKRDRLRDSQDQIDALQREIALIGASNAERLRSNALAEAEIEIRKRQLTGLDAIFERVLAIARANAEAARDQEKALFDIRTAGLMDGYDGAIADTRNPYTKASLEAAKEYANVMASTGDVEQATASSARVHAKAIADVTRAQVDYLRGQRESIQQLQLELALVGQTEAVRARVLALAAAERDIQRLGASGDVADQMKRNAVLLAEGTLIAESQADAWKRVQSAGESAIDSVLDKLKSGDVKGALSDFLGEIEKGFFDLSVRNPLKNALFGTNLGTWKDVGGWGGIFGKMAGKNGVNEADLVSKATASVQAMDVSAANVIIGGPGAMSFLQGIGSTFGAANSNATPMAGQPASAQVQGFLSSVAVGGGTRPGAISGLNAALADPLAAMIADAQRVFGDGAVKISSAFRSVERQQQLWQEALQKYGSPEVARKWVAPPGNSRHNFGLAADLEYSNPSVESWMHQNAGRYGLNYRMQNEDWHIEPKNAGTMMTTTKGANPIDQRLASTEAAMARFQGQVDATGQGVVVLGNGASRVGQGMQGFGASLQGLISGIGAQHGPLGSFAGGLLNWAISALPGHQAGGWTGSAPDNAVAGVVHGGEYVFDAPVTRKIGVANLEAIRRGALPGYRDGGYVVGGLPAAIGDASAPAGNVNMPPQDRKIVAEINVSGSGDREIQRGVHAAIAQAFDFYSREVFPGQVKMVINDKWGS